DREHFTPLGPRRAERVAGPEDIRELPGSRVESTPGGLVNGRHEAFPFRFEPGDNLRQAQEERFLGSARPLVRQAWTTREHKPLGGVRTVLIPPEHPPEGFVMI